MREEQLAFFTVTNTSNPGEGALEGPTNWLLFQNNVIVQSGTLQLLGCESRTFTSSLTGTLRSEVVQRPGHPRYSLPRASVSCVETPTPTATSTSTPTSTPTATATNT